MEGRILSDLLGPERFAATKGLGRIILLIAIALGAASLVIDLETLSIIVGLIAIVVYGTGLLLKRAAAERDLLRDA